MQLEAYQQLAAQLQQTAATEVFEVGGYWPVLVALSVVGDDIGHASSKILAGDRHGAAVHLGNANWVLACVANQYCCKLDNVQEATWKAFHSDTDFHLDGSDDYDLKAVLLRLFMAFGKITRIANRYEVGVLTDNEENNSIVHGIQEAQWAIIAAIKLCGKDPVDLVEVRRAEVRSYRGKKKFPAGLRPDPSYGDSFERFRALANVTMCPFAKTAKVWAIGPWRVKSTAAKDFAAASEETLNRFIRVCQPEGFDGIVIEAMGIASLEDLKSRTNELLRALGEFSDRNPMTSPIEKKEWRFGLNGVDVFVTIFSSVYEDKHPRYSQSKNSSFYFLQPQLSFKAKAAKEKERIREKFSQNGQDYRPILKKIKCEAEKYIKPEDLQNGQPVRWWK